MNQASDVINLEEFRKRRGAKAQALRPQAPTLMWSPVWFCWVMVWPG